jgi:hypothetical protein
VVYSFKGVDMSQGGEVTTQQLVYGPDGKVYGNPALARAAGVNQYYREDGTPYPVAQQTLPTPMPYNQPMPAPSFGGMGSVDPYSQIMGQMTPTMNPYTGAGVAIGGYDPALYRRMSGSGLINLGQGGYGGGSGGGMGGGGSGAPSGPIAPTTPEEFAAQSARNQQINDFLTNISKVSLTGLISSGLVGLLGGKPQSPAPVEDVGTYFGKNPMNDFGFATQAEADAINAAINEAAGFAVADDAAAAAQQNNNVAAGLAAAADAEAAAQGGGSTSGGDSGYSGGTTGAGNEGGGIGAGEGLAQGGKVTKRHLKGPDPKGPDEGYGALLSGEYVIKKSAVKKYGQGLLDMINDGKIPAKKMKSLLG